MIRYIHGSEDSTDVDIHYVFDKLPDLTECKRFCSEDKNENRNIIVINDGIVTECYKGTTDEVNNGLFHTYQFHNQEYPLLINRTIPRIKPLKYVRAVRGILSHLSKSQYRKEIKNALKSDWITRLYTLSCIDLSTIVFNSLQNNMSGSDILKLIAFQIGQCLGLYYNDGEFYTKSEIANEYYDLKKFLYRKDNIVIDKLQRRLDEFLTAMCTTSVKYDKGSTLCTFKDDNITIDLIHECIV